jgi:hypothetical protein
VHDDVGLHERHETAHRIGVGDVTMLEADIGRDSLRNDVGRDDFDAAPGQRPDNILANLARSARE